VFFFANATALLYSFYAYVSTERMTRKAEHF